MKEPKVCQIQRHFNLESNGSTENDNITTVIDVLQCISVILKRQ